MIKLKSRSIVNGVKNTPFTKKVKSKSLELLKSIEDFSQDNIKNIFIEKIQEWGMKNGEVLWPIRAALTGKERSPGAFEVSSALGKEKTIQRIEFVIEKLKLF